MFEKPVPDRRPASREKLMAEVDDAVDSRDLLDGAVVVPVAADRRPRTNALIDDVIVNPPEPVKVEAKPKLRVHKPEPEPVPALKARDPFDPLDGLDDLVFDDAKLAAMMANMASHGMSHEDIFG